MGADWYRMENRAAECLALGENVALGARQSLRYRRGRSHLVCSGDPSDKKVALVGARALQGRYTDFLPNSARQLTQHFRPCFPKWHRLAGRSQNESRLVHESIPGHA